MNLSGKISARHTRLSMRNTAERVKKFFLHLEAQLAQVQERMTWQPIDTAPKDGTRVLLWDGRCVTCGGFDALLDENFPGKEWQGMARYWGSSSYFILSIRPTHWMQMPEPPEADHAG